MLYVICVVVIGLLGFIRIFALCRRIEWRNDLENMFPDACGSWAIENGCTRVTLLETGCTRQDEIASENSLVFNAKNGGPNFMYQ